MRESEHSEGTVNNGDGDIEDMRGPPIGYDRFIEVRENDFLYVDKTALVDRILSDTVKAYLFTRPRRFGKSLNLSMLDAYFNMEYRGKAEAWFDGLEISKLRPGDPEMNAYPVVYLNFNDVTGNDYQTIVGSFSEYIALLYGRFEYLADSDALSTPQRTIFKRCMGITDNVSTLASAVKNLCEMLEKHHGRKVILLIDEYDKLVNDAYGEPHQEQVLKLIHDILSPAIKSNNGLEFAVVTGVMQIAKEGIFSGLNNVCVDNVMDTEFDDMFGFTSDEVRNLLEESEHPESFDEVREWYDGYRFGNADIYNPWSVLYYIRKGFKPSEKGWTNTGSTEMIDDMIWRAEPKVHSEILALSAGETINHDVDPAITFEQISTGTDALYSVMVMAGYLKAVPDGRGPKSCSLSAPNREVSGAFMTKLIEKMGVSQESKNLISATFSGDAENLRDAIQSYLEPLIHSDLRWESSYKIMLYGAYRALCTEHDVYPDPRAGNGYSDITLRRVRGHLPNVVMEFKRLDSKTDVSEERFQKEAEKALAQIHDRDYSRTLKGRTILYGMAFHRKDVEIVKEEIEKD